MQNKTKRQNFLSRVKNKYRLVVMNDDTFEERMSLRLSPLAFFIMISSIVILFIVVIISTIAFTPLREYIPGYADVNARKELKALYLKADSLEENALAKDEYVKNISAIIMGDTLGSPAPDKLTVTKKPEGKDLLASESEKSLRMNIEAQEKFTLSSSGEGSQKSNISSFFFFSPIKGLITTSFNLADAHYGVDIVAPENEGIKSTLDGTVIFTGWTTETGYNIQVQHSNNLVSVYKHNSALLKKQGEYVKAGEVIAIIGNTGEQTTGPHLHFELWHNGNAIDPQEYMAF